MQRTRIAIAVISLSLAVSTAVNSASAQGRGRGGNPDAQQPATQAAPAAGANAAPRVPLPDEKSSVTQHEMKLGGQTISYTATAATYNIKADDGTTKAQYYFVAYTRNGVPSLAKRPVSFIYNGGSGSSSPLTPHGLGPQRLAPSRDG